MNCVPLIREFSKKTLQYRDFVVFSLGAKVKENCLDASLIQLPPMRNYPNLTTFPHTPGDFFIHIKAKNQGEVFDISYAFTSLIPLEKISQVIDYTEVLGFSYQVGRNGLGRDLSGFEDGTENPPQAERKQHAITVNGTSFILTQTWVHNLKLWNKIPVDQQEKIIGRTKKDSRELQPLPQGSHVERTEDNKMYRQSMPWGDSKLNGLFFIAYAKDLHVYHHTLRMMGGAYNNVHDKMTQTLSKAITGAYWFAPNLEQIRQWTLTK